MNHEFTPPDFLGMYNAKTVDSAPVAALQLPATDSRDDDEEREEFFSHATGYFDVESTPKGEIYARDGEVWVKFFAGVSLPIATGDYLDFITFCLRELGVSSLPIDQILRIEIKDVIGVASPGKILLGTHDKGLIQIAPSAHLTEFLNTTAHELTHFCDYIYDRSSEHDKTRSYEKRFFEKRARIKSAALTGAWQIKTGIRQEVKL